MLFGEKEANNTRFNEQVNALKQVMCLLLFYRKYRHPLIYIRKSLAYTN